MTNRSMYAKQEEPVPQLPASPQELIDQFVTGSMAITRMGTGASSSK